MMRAAGFAVGLWTLGAGMALADDPPGLDAFASAADLNAWVAEHAVQDPPLCPDPNLAACEEDDEAEYESIVVTGSRIPVASAIATTPVTDQASITNNQEVGVDEGDIVKLSGDILIILRRGRLFTVNLSGGGMRAADTIDAYPPGFVAGPDSWYDEMLVSNGWIVVIGYLYDGEISGTQINRFRLGAEGELTYVDSYHIATDDYYSSVNYASRLLGDQLVLYTPDYIHSESDPLAHLPTLRRWTGKAGPVVEQALVRAQDVRRTPRGIEDVNTIHAITRCDLTAPELTCRATAVLGPEARSFYASADAAYLWLSGTRRSDEEDMPSAVLYRLPFDGGRPQAIQARGVPIDQFSFQEDPVARRLYAMVVSDGYGDAMWAPDFASGSAALLTLDLSRFGDGSGETRRGDYRALPPAPEGASWGVRNRFVGDALIYTTTTRIDFSAPDDHRYEEERAVSLIHVVPVDGSTITTLMTPGVISRIEPMGRDALVVSNQTDGMIFGTVDLNGSEPQISDRHFVEEAAEAERRSHAFFFSPDAASPDGETGVLGLPIYQPGYRRSALFDDEASVIFLRRDQNRLNAYGQLESWAEAQDDHCMASCIDWYGDSRPIFIGDRTFALLGYDLVEGRASNGRMRRVAATYFGPRPGTAKD